MPTSTAPTAPNNPDKAATRRSGTIEVPDADDCILAGSGKLRAVGRDIDRPGRAPWTLKRPGKRSPAKIPLPDDAVVAAAVQVSTISAEGDGGRAVRVRQLFEHLPVGSLSNDDCAGGIAGCQ